MRTHRFLVTLLVTLLVIACGGTAPTTARYLLRSEVSPGSARLEPPVWIALDRVEVAPYLDAPGLVVETQTHQVHAARRHLWAESLPDGLRRFLTTEISGALGYPIGADASDPGPWDHTVSVSIERLHGSLSGEAVLAARWWIEPRAGAGEVSRYRFVAMQPLPREGYGGLVDAEIALVRQLAVAIADSLKGATGK